MSPSATELFARLRPRLMGIGYRMLGSVQEAEDLVQDAWLRWHDELARPGSAVLVPEAWLVTVTTRMAIDRLRAARLRREAYPDHWLPEPWLEATPATPEQIHERADDVSVAFLMLLDGLTPQARAAFLLRDVFDADYPQVALALGKSEAAARQIVHRARQRVSQLRAAERQRVPTPPQQQYALLARLVRAITQGDFQAIQALLAEEAALMGDFGGARPRLLVPLRGARRIAQLYYANHLRFGNRMRLEPVVLNGGWALVRYVEGELESVQAFEFDDGRIAQVRIQRSPAKLIALRRHLALLRRSQAG